MLYLHAHMYRTHYRVKLSHDVMSRKDGVSSPWESFPQPRHADLRPEVISDGWGHTSWDARLLEFYTILFGEAANEELCHHTFRLGAESVFRSIGTEVRSSLHQWLRGADSVLPHPLAPTKPHSHAHRKPSTNYSRLRVFGDVPPPPVADALLHTLERDEQFAKLRPAVANALGVPEAEASPQLVLWCAGRVGMHELLRIIPKEKLEAHAIRVLYKWQGPLEFLTEVTKLHRRRDEYRINGDHLEIAPSWDDLPRTHSESDPVVLSSFRCPAHMVFFIADTVHRPRIFSSPC
mmetsp:Transcript_151382/g.264476  ORF Transcript_151382/g.264476 Transcript_151382/m.264476 type:complete len:292 (-) Transcript_151382:64-939(-)